jgi:hypothetical protein
MVTSFFGSVVVVVFQSVFYLEMYENNTFFLKENIFDSNVSK